MTATGRSDAENRLHSTSWKLSALPADSSADVMFESETPLASE